MIKLWESLGSDSLSQTSKIKKFQMFLKIVKLRNIVGRVLKRFNPSRFGPEKEDWKFPALDNDDIQKRFTRLKHVLKINVELECKLLTDQTISIKRL